MYQTIFVGFLYSCEIENDVKPCQECGTLRLATVGTELCYVCEDAK